MSGAVRRAFSLVEMLVVIVIIAILAAFLMPRYLGGKDGAGKKITSPMQKAHSVECQNNLSQIRQAYTMASTLDEEHRPQSLAELRSQGVSDAMTRCPVGKQAYQFDPSTGRARCVHPGHEAY